MNTEQFNQGFLYGFSSVHCFWWGGKFAVKAKIVIKVLHYFSFWNYLTTRPPTTSSQNVAVCHLSWKKMPDSGMKPLWLVDFLSLFLVPLKTNLPLQSLMCCGPLIWLLRCTSADWTVQKVFHWSYSFIVVFCFCVEFVIPTWFFCRK